MQIDLKMSSLACKSVFYKTDGVQRGPHEIEF